MAPVALRLLRALRRSIVVGCGVLRAPPPQVLPPLQIIHSAVYKARPGNVTCTEKPPATPRQYTSDTRLQSLRVVWSEQTYLRNDKLFSTIPQLDSGAGTPVR